MLTIKLICVGKLKERFYIDAQEEYVKRLKSYCRLEIDELPESRLGQNPSQNEINAALSSEGEAILQKIPKGAAMLAMCIEGTQTDSVELSKLLTKYSVDGMSRLCFVIGGSFGLSENIKNMAGQRISMSKMTFPHHLARIMLLEQIYRVFKICEGGKYHK